MSWEVVGRSLVDYDITHGASVILPQSSVDTWCFSLMFDLFLLICLLQFVLSVTVGTLFSHFFISLASNARIVKRKLSQSIICISKSEHSENNNMNRRRYIYGKGNFYQLHIYAFVPSISQVL